jgi:hypothetical protein
MRNLLPACFAALLPILCPATSPRFTDGPVAAMVGGGDTVDPSVQLGWHAGYDVAPSINLQLGYSYHSDSISARDLAALGLPVGSQVDLDLHTLSASSRWYAWTGDLTGIYAVAGVQFMLANEESDKVNRAIVRQNSPIRDFSASVHKEFGFHAGLGIERSLTSNWETFLEYRHVWHEAGVDYTLVTVDPQGARRGVETNGTLPYDYDALRLGINYRF